MSSDGTTRLIFTMQSDQSTLVANFGPFLPLPISGTLQNVLNLVNNAESSVTNAINSASAANISATNAAASATAANTSANNAAASATAASTSAATASNYSTLSQDWASQATGTVNGTTSYSSYYYSEQSQYWAGVSQAVVAITATWDIAKKNSVITLSNGNLTAAFAGGQAVALGNVGYTSGKYYFEVTYAAGSVSNNCSIGIAPKNVPLDSQVGYNDGTGAVGAFQGSGNIYVNGSNKGGTTPFTTVGNIVGVAVDLDDGLIWYRLNNGWWNASSSADPVAKVGGISFTTGSAMFPAICSDTQITFTGNFSGNFVATMPTGYKAWTVDAYHYVVPYATAATPGIVSAGPGLLVNSQGQLSADSYYDLAQVSGSSTISIDLTTPVPGYHVVLNAATATFRFANFSLPTGKALRLTFYFEQGTGSNTITSWDSRIHWVGGSPPVLGYTIGNRNVVEVESIDGTTFAGYYVGQIN